MKVALVCPYNIGSGSGVFEIIKELHRGMVDRGHDAVILTPQPRDSVTLAPEHVIFLGGGTEIRSPTHTTLQVSATVDTDAINEVLEREKFDIIHFHEPWVPVLSRQILSRSRSINIATFHGVVPETMVSRTVARVVTPYALSIIKYIHEFTAVSDAASDYIRSLTDNPVTIIPNGIDLNCYHPLTLARPEPKRKYNILFIGRLERRKGLNYLLRAYSLLEKRLKNLSLIIAGHGPDMEKLKLLSRNLGIKSVVFKGYVDDRTKLNLLQRADLFCSPALYGESFGIVLLEAMATGAVSIVGNNKGYDALMSGLGQLSVINPRDVPEFTRRMELLLVNRQLRELWKDWAVDYVQQYDYPKIIDEYEDLYQRAIRKYGRTT